MDASISTSGPSKSYYNVSIKNYAELVGAKDKMLVKPPNTVLGVYFDPIVDAKGLRSRLEHFAKSFGRYFRFEVMFLEKDPTQVNDIVEDSASVADEMDYSSYQSSI